MSDCPHNPFSSEVIANPYPYYAWLHANAPVYEVPGADYFAISSYQGIKEVCKNPDIFSSSCTSFLRKDEEGRIKVMDTGASEAKTGIVLGIVDPPDHTRQRAPLSKCFAPRVRQMEDWLRKRCELLMDEAIKKGGMNYMADYASVIPSLAISYLLGFPLEDIKKLDAWSSAAAQTIGGISTDADLIEKGMAILDFQQYVEDKFNDAKQSPGDNLMGDLATLLKSPDNNLSADEMLGMLFQLLVGGHETTAGTIGASLLMSEQFPSVYNQVKQDYTLIPSYLEEVIRLETPAQGNYRKTTEETVLAGVTLPKDSVLILMWGAANRDENEFKNAHELIINRPNIKNHLGFGKGIHFCIGAALARLESRVAMEVFLSRTENLKVNLNDKKTEYLPSLFIRRPAKMAVLFS